MRTIRADLAELWRPPPIETVAEWANANRILGSTSAKPGPWRTDRTPYLRQILEDLSPYSRVRTVVLMFASQLGKSEVANNLIGYSIHRDPGPMLLAQPTDRDLRDYVRQRLRPMIRDSPVLRDRVSDPKSRDGDNTLEGMSFPGGFLRTVTANSASALASTPVRKLMLDEIDRYPLDVDGEGDPVKLGEQRTVTFENAKILKTSTPTIKDKSRIEQEYDGTDRNRYWVPCPHCGEFQVLRWEQVQWPKGRPEDAAYICEHSGCVVENHEKNKMLAGGEWRAENPGAQGGKVRGYHLSAIYAPHGLGPTFGDLAEEFTNAKRLKDPTLLQAFINLKLGETWDVSDGDGVDTEGLLSLRERWRRPKGVTLWVPKPAAVLTCGVDVQDDRLELEVVGWGEHFESWSVDYRVIPGDPSGKELWADLDELIRRKFPSGWGRSLKISATAIDTGGHYTDAAYKFVKPRQRRRRIWGVKGRSGDYPIWPEAPSRKNKGGIDLYMLGVDAAKKHIYDRLTVVDHGPGFCHFPLERGAGYFDQLTAEVYETRWARGRKTLNWRLRKAGTRNEALDCRVYAYAAFLGWLRTGKTIGRVVELLSKPVDKPDDSQQPRKRPTREPPEDWIGAGKGWL